MDNGQMTNWEQAIEPSKFEQNKNMNLDSMYERAHTELSLQQSKRDQIITIYLALCSFLIPFALGEEVISFELKGLIFLVIAIVGILFSLIAVRYREYKEVYWLCCQSITVLQNIKQSEIDKTTIQRVFYHCLYKKGHGYLRKDGKKEKINVPLFIKKNIFSAETLHFVIIDIMTAFISGLGAALILNVSVTIRVLFGVVIGMIVFLLLIVFYFKTCLKIYMVLEKDEAKTNQEARDKAFSSIFSKAWFLHMYYDGQRS